MVQGIASRDYSLVGPEGARAVDDGLAGAEWFHCRVARKRMKELMQRRDGPAIRDTLIWLGCLTLFGGLGVWFWGSWLALPFFLCYGVLYGSAADSRWHECGHGTPFRTRWMNDAVYQIASFMIMKDPVIWRWSHTRHHTDTLVVGRDPEIVAMRPPRLAKIVANFFGLIDVPVAFYQMLVHACGRLTAEEQTFIPEMERHKVFRNARIWLSIYAAVAAACLATGSILPAMLIGLPRMYGAWNFMWHGLTQHAGLAEDVLDHRLNCRTVYFDRVNRFIYWNMNYHLEHHMFPMVPYHALPQLHEEIKGQCPPAYNGLWHAYQEILPAIFRQLKDPSYFVRRELPAGASPHFAPAAVAVAAE